MESSIPRIIHRASQLDEDLVGKSIALLTKIIELETEIERSSLDEETRDKLIQILKMLKDEISQDILQARRINNLYNPKIQVYD
ncbi:MAG: hypothetical protein QXE81_00865 [Desulfurococcaceae archaeon]